MPNDGKPEHIEPEESTRTQLIKGWPKLAAVIAAAVVPPLMAYFGAGEAAKNQAGEVKDKSEAGFQFTREALIEIRTAIKGLQEADAKQAAELTEIKRRARLSASKRRAEGARVAPPPPPLVAPAPAPSAPLPTDLDKALAEQKAAAK